MFSVAVVVVDFQVYRLVTSIFLTIYYVQASRSLYGIKFISSN